MFTCSANNVIMAVDFAGVLMDLDGAWTSPSFPLFASVKN
jgi:hypothetical protein